MKRTAKFAAALVAGSMLLTACSSGGDEPAPTTTPPDGDNPSGTVTLYTSEPQAKIDEIIAAFNAHYPDVTIETFRAGTGDLTARVESDILAQEAPQADIFLAADVPTFEGYVERDLFLNYVPTDADKLIQDILDPEGFYVGTRIIPTVIAYNTNSVENPPTSWAELTD